MNNPFSNETVSFIPLGGSGDVTKNMYVYEYKDEILIVDCGLGFADETMVGVDLLLPDITYLLQTKKKIVGMVLTHGHEDHIGAVPFILPQLPQIPVYASPLTAAFANEKLKEFGIGTRVQTVAFEEPQRRLGNFTVTFIRITHSVPDTSNIFISTPVGNFYHGSDFKFDLTPADGKKTDFTAIAAAGGKGVLCLMSDCLGVERSGSTPSEQAISDNFEREVKEAKGKCIITTYSSNISRLNQAIEVAQRLNRRVCFLGRSLVKAKEVAVRLGYMKFRQGLEIPVDQLHKYPDNQILLLVAGSQGQENSALTRMANGEHKDVKLTADDVVIFSSDPIPGNEVSVNSLIDTLARRGLKVVYSTFASTFHISGHGYMQDLLLMMSLTKPHFLVPIGGTYKHMVAYRNLAQTMGYSKEHVSLLEDGQELIFTKNNVRKGKKVSTKNVYVDEVSGEEVDHYILRDRQKLSEGGIVVLMLEVDSDTGEVMGPPDVLVRGFTMDNKKVAGKIYPEVRAAFGNKKGKVTNWSFMRRRLTEIGERVIFRELRRRPLVLSLVIEA